MLYEYSRINQSLMIDKLHGCHDILKLVQGKKGLYTDIFQSGYIFHRIKNC